MHNNPMRISNNIRHIRLDTEVLNPSENSLMATVIHQLATINASTSVPTLVFNENPVMGSVDMN